VVALRGQKTLLFQLNEDGSQVADLALPTELNDAYGRLRGVRSGPDGALYITTSNERSGARPRGARRGGCARITASTTAGPVGRRTRGSGQLRIWVVVEEAVGCVVGDERVVDEPLDGAALGAHVAECVPRG
jgi:hypothetical protein